MSAEAMAWAWKQAPRCGNQGNYLVLLALAEHANPEGEGFPGRAKIAQMCGFSDKGTVTRNINKLVALGLVKKGPRFDPAREGRQTSNIYELPLEEGPATPPASQAATPPVAPEATPPGGDTGQPRKQQPLKQQQEDTVSADVKEVYDHFLTIFKSATAPKLGPSLIRQIEKGLKEYDATALCRAVEGLREWRKQKPGKETLGAIFDTYPGGKPLTEQIAFFISQAKGSTGVGRSFPSADRAIVAEQQRLVQRGHRLQQNEEAVKQAKDAEAWLRQHGIGTTINSEGTPVFAPLAAPDAAAGSAS